MEHEVECTWRVTQHGLEHMAESEAPGPCNRVSVTRGSPKATLWKTEHRRMMRPCDRHLTWDPGAYCHRPKVILLECGGVGVAVGYLSSMQILTGEEWGRISV